MIRKCASPIPNHVRVFFELPALLWADRVSLVADFNDWNPDAIPFRQERDGVWRAVVDLPICRRFEFRYLIDGAWVTDIHADDATPNKYGSFNSVVTTNPLVVRPDRMLGHGTIQERLAMESGWNRPQNQPVCLQETDSKVPVPLARQWDRPIRRIHFSRRHFRRQRRRYSRCSPVFAVRL